MHAPPLIIKNYERGSGSEKSEKSDKNRKFCEVQLVEENLARKLEEEERKKVQLEMERESLRLIEKLSKEGEIMSPRFNITPILCDTTESPHPFPPKTRITVVGGGPVGMIFSLLCVIYCNDTIHIDLYEQRWVKEFDGKVRYKTVAEGNIRREQVVTLQDDVCLTELPILVTQELFKNVYECVWPSSKNIPIKEVEDRMLHLIQSPSFRHSISLHAKSVKAEDLKSMDFDFLAVSDGGGPLRADLKFEVSQLHQESDRALGVAFDLGMNVPQSQALNVILTICQTRYLLNSNGGRKGYLNVRLTESEWTMIEKGRSQLSKYWGTEIHDLIIGGLNLFKIPASCVTSIVPIDIPLLYSQLVCKEIPSTFLPIKYGTTKNENRTNPLVCLLGDCAIKHHFWPGRGLNSGIKSAVALSRSVFQALKGTGLVYNNFNRFEGFMAALRARETCGRSGAMFLRKIDQALVHNDEIDELTLINKFKERIINQKNRMEARENWPHKGDLILDSEIDTIFSRMEPSILVLLSKSESWPLKNMSGMELHVKDFFDAP